MLKQFSGKGSKTPRGSLRSLSDWSPVLVTIVVTFKFSNPSTFVLGVEVLTVKLGAAETAMEEATRATREAWREEEEENIVMKAVKVVDETTPMKPRD
jgi:hypothetical protein